MANNPTDLDTLAESGEPLLLRPATKDDLNDILWIVKAAYPDHPACDYKYPFRKESKEHMADFEKWTRLQYAAYLDQPDKYRFLLVTAPGLSHDRLLEPIHKPIALAVWDVAVDTTPIDAEGTYERKDANVAHIEAFEAALSRAFATHFGNYHGRQMHLDWLTTHPAFRRRGAGAMLCNWGLKEAAKRGGWTLTVTASQVGSALYEKLGYTVLGKEVAQVSGEDEALEFDVLEKRP